FCVPCSRTLVSTYARTAPRWHPWRDAGSFALADALLDEFDDPANARRRLTPALWQVELLVAAFDLNAVAAKKGEFDVAEYSAGLALGAADRAKAEANKANKM